MIETANKGKARRRAAAGFTLIELMIVVAIIGLLAAVAFPSYSNHVIRAAREGAQTELIDLSALQEKIYLNSNAYTANVTAGYDGTSAGGLGIATGRTRDAKYNFSVTVAAQTFTLTATPVSGGPQANDSNLTISSNGARTWGTKTW